LKLINRKTHWENIYSTKNFNEVSWYQPVPETSLDFIKKLNLNKDANIIDIGGGDSFLVDNLLQLGYSNITVLDISEKAIDRAKERLGKEAKKVNWIVSDVNDFEPTDTYDLWHDRAAFHFLTGLKEINRYTKTVTQHLSLNGYVILGTFSKKGPLKCSGIEITQYNTQDLITTFRDLRLIESKAIEHATPFDTTQNFTFACFEIKTKA
jgi:cyclopropane fatty-acyl-phospholipid synthase-like methyltransferase